MRRIAHIAFKEFSPPHKMPVPVNQVVDGYRVEPFLRQLFAAMGADVPGSAGHQYVHILKLPKVS
jgi:hypothetical protein